MQAVQRLKGLGWLFSCVVVVLGCYMISLSVAAERNKLNATNLRILQAQRDLRALSTEFDTRANMAQLERWNGDVLALTAPAAAQYLHGEAQFAAMLRNPGMTPQVQMASLVVPAGVTPIQTANAAAVAVVAATPAAPAPVARQAVAVEAPMPTLQPAVLTKTRRDGAQGAGGGDARPAIAERFHFGRYHERRAVRGGARTLMATAPLRPLVARPLAAAPGRPGPHQHGAGRASAAGHPVAVLHDGRVAGDRPAGVPGDLGRTGGQPRRRRWRWCRCAPTSPTATVRRWRARSTPGRSGVQPANVIGDKGMLADELARIFPERDAAWFLARLNQKSSFTYLAVRALPGQVEAVNALGEPGIKFGREPQRLYPQSSMAAHALGFLDNDGIAQRGMERVLEARLLDPALRDTPVALSLDARVQAAMESELGQAMAAYGARGAAGVVLDVDSGEVMALASLPVFNPNKIKGSTEDMLRNNVTQSVYELGSAFKPITMAAAINDGVVTNMARRFDATAPLQIGRFKIKDDHAQNRWLNIPETLIHSSNIATARIAEEIGPEKLQATFRSLGFDTAPGDRIARAAEAAVAALLGAHDDDDDRLRARHRGDAAASGERLCGAGQRRHLAAGDADEGATASPPPGAACSARRPATGCASCCG